MAFGGAGWRSARGYIRNGLDLINQGNKIDEGLKILGWRSIKAPTKFSYSCDFSRKS